MTIAPEYDYECIHNQRKAILVGVRTVLKNGMTDEQLHYYRGIDVCSTYQHTADKYILLVLFGDKHIPFAVIEDYSEDKLQFYKQHKNEVFDINVINKQQSTMKRRTKGIDQ